MREVSYLSDKPINLVNGICLAIHRVYAQAGPLMPRRVVDLLAKDDQRLPAFSRSEYGLGEFELLEPVN